MVGKPVGNRYTDRNPGRRWYDKLSEYSSEIEIIQGEVEKIETSFKVIENTLTEVRTGWKLAILLAGSLSALVTLVFWLIDIWAVFSQVH
jgi:hypothetical protein